MEGDGWKARHLAREATRNVFGRGSRLFTMLAIAVGLGIACSAYFAWEWHGLEQSLDDLGMRGRDVVVFQSGDTDAPARIDRATCEALSDDASVQRSGVLISAGRLDVIPVGSSVPVYRVSTSLMPELGSSDALLGSAIAGRQAGATLDIRIGESVLDSRVSSPQPEGVGLNSAIALATGPTDTTAPVCIVVFSRFANLREAVPVASAALESDGQPLRAVPVLRETVNSVDSYLGRPTRFLPLLLGILGGLVIGIGTLLRSSELAAYRLSGSSGTSVAILLAMEALLLGGIAAVSGALSGLAWIGTVEPSGVLILRALILGASCAVTAGLLSLAVARKRPNELAKDR